MTLAERRITYRRTMIGRSQRCKRAQYSYRPRSTG